jgi:DNA-binding response OmpR family regulator
MAQKLLLIEDDQTMLALLSTLLTYEGFEVAAVSEDDSVETILQNVQQAAPEVVLLDVHLRRVYGLDVLEAIRKTCGKTPRVVMSSGSDLRQRCLDLGADGFIMKPYMPEDLIRSIRQALAIS